MQPPLHQEPTLGGAFSTHHYKTPEERGGAKLAGLSGQATATLRLLVDQGEPLSQAMIAATLLDIRNYLEILTNQGRR